MQSIRDTMTQIGREVRRVDGNDPPTFASGRLPLQPLLTQLGVRLPEDIGEYVDHCIPDVAFGPLVEFHDVESLLVEHDELEPGADLLAQGFLCIGKEGDGTQFAYDLHTSKVFHVESAYDTADDTREEAWYEWDSLVDFLGWVLQSLRALPADESGAAPGRVSPPGGSVRVDPGQRPSIRTQAPTSEVSHGRVHRPRPRHPVLDRPDVARRRCVGRVLHRRLRLGR